MICGQQFTLLGGGYEPVILGPAGTLLLLLVLLQLCSCAQFCAEIPMRTLIPDQLVRG